MFSNFRSKFGISGLIEPTTHIVVVVVVVVVHRGIWVTNWIIDKNFLSLQKLKFDVHEITLKKLRLGLNLLIWGPHVNLCNSMNENSVCCELLNLPIRIMTFKICKPIPAEPREIGAARWETLYTCNVQTLVLISIFPQLEQLL
jgi:hypothetical protein